MGEKNVNINATTSSYSERVNRKVDERKDEIVGEVVQEEDAELKDITG